MRLFGRNLWIGVRHCENNGVRRHACNHLGGHSTFGRNAQEHVSAIHRIREGAGIRGRSVSRLPLVHTFGTALVDNALGVAHDAVVVLCAHRFDQLKAGNPCRARAVQNDLTIFDLFARDVQRVDQASGTNNSGPVLVVVKDGDIHLFFEALLNDEALRRLDVFEVDATERRSKQANSAAEFIWVFGINLKVDRVHICEPFEEHRFALHHRFRCERTEVTKAQNSGAVRDHSHKVALVGVVICRLRAGRDFLAGDRNARRIGKRQIPLGHHGHGRRDLPLPGVRFHVERQCILACDLRFGHCFLR